MKKAFFENLEGVRIENDDGDLIPVSDVVANKLAELVGAVVSTNKAGRLTLKIDMKPSTSGTLAVKADVSLVKPKGLPAEALLWPTPDGNLEGSDFHQKNLDLKPVQTEEFRQLKSV
jgi:hypothetical protein